MLDIRIKCRIFPVSHLLIVHDVNALRWIGLENGRDIYVNIRAL